MSLNLTNRMPKRQVSVHNIRLPKQSTIGDVIDELKGKVHLPVTSCRVNKTSIAWEVIEGL